MSMEYSVDVEECGEWNYEKKKWKKNYIRCFDLDIIAPTIDEAMKVFEMIDEWYLNEEAYDGITPFAYCPTIFDDENDVDARYCDLISFEYLKDIWMMDTVAEVKKEFFSDWKRCKKEILTKIKNS